MHMIRIRRQGCSRVENKKSEGIQVTSCAQETCRLIGKVLLLSKAAIFVSMKTLKGGLVMVNRRLRTGDENL